LRGIFSTRVNRAAEISFEAGYRITINNPHPYTYHQSVTKANNYEAYHTIFILAVIILRW